MPAISPTAPRPPVDNDAQRGTTKSGGRKHTLDKFYTQPHVVAACLDRLDLGRYGRIIEPSAGAGAFSETLSDRAPHAEVFAFDVAPEHPNVDHQDWFAYTERTDAATLVVGNPPFGQQCSLAVRFINHAVDVVGAATVAFVLPRSFRKASVQNRVSPWLHLADEVILGPNSFELDCADYDLPAVFQVWEARTSTRRVEQLPTTSRHVTFTKKDEPHHFAVRRVGGRAGHAFVDDETTSPQSNYFIRVDCGLDPGEVLELVNSLDVSVADDGTGPRTLSKRELVALIDDAFTRANSDAT